VSDARIRWQCRRGTRELDHLLLGWFDTCYAASVEAQKSAFRELLELQDPELIAYLLGSAKPTELHIADVVRSIRNRIGSR
jgi:antitoxin CptB